MEVGNTEHDPLPRDSSFSHELIQQDISESVDEPLPQDSSFPDERIREDIISESVDELKELNCFPGVSVLVESSGRADNIQQSSSLAFHNWPEIGTESPPRTAADFVFNPRKLKCKARIPFEDISFDASSNPVCVPFEEIVTVRAKAVNDNDDETEYIHKEEAICRVCCTYVLEEINLLRTRCKCDLTLLHEKCALEWSGKEENKNCHTCEELIHYIPVTLSTTSTEEIPQKPSFGKRFPKKFSSLFGRKNG